MWDKAINPIPYEFAYILAALLNKQHLILDLFCFLIIMRPLVEIFIIAYLNQ